MSNHLFFLLGFSFLLAHEMDAVRAREWKMLPVLSGMGEEAGYRTFVLLHVPLYALLLWTLREGDASFGLVVVLDAFFVVHLLLHVFLRNLPENRFGSALSWSLILGSGVSGAIDLLLSL